MNYINCPKVRRFGLYVSMVTDGEWTKHLKGDNTISCSPLSLSNF